MQVTLTEVLVTALNLLLLWELHQTRVQYTAIIHRWERFATSLVVRRVQEALESHVAALDAKPESEEE